MNLNLLRTSLIGLFGFVSFPALAANNIDNCATFLETSAKQVTSFTELDITTSDFLRMSFKKEVSDDFKTQIFSDVHSKDESMARSKFISPAIIEDYQGEKRILIAKPYSLPFYSTKRISFELVMAVVKNNQKLDLWNDALNFEFDQRKGKLRWEELASNGEFMFALGGQKEMGVWDEINNAVKGIEPSGRVVRIHDLMGGFLGEFAVESPKAKTEGGHWRRRGISFVGNDVYYMLSHHDQNKVTSTTPLFIYKYNVLTKKVETREFEITVPSLNVTGFVINKGQLIVKGLVRNEQTNTFETKYFGAQFN